MMVDDEPIMMEIVQAHLEEVGYQHFISVEDSRCAFDVLAHRRPDILFLDLVMPNVSGFDLLRQIRQHEAFTYLPVIVLTSSSDSASKLRALELGATDFLAKPVDASELKLRLRNTLTVKAYLDQLTNFDPLTGLVNRKQLSERLRWTLKVDQLHANKTGLLSIGLDRFGKINESLGIETGDQVLKQVGERLKALVEQRRVFQAGTEDTETEIALARLSGDEFAVLLPSISQHDQAALLARQIIDSLSDAFVVNEKPLFITASIGIAVSPDDGISSNDMLKNAGAAMRVSKEKGVAGFQFYSRAINSDWKARLSLETDLHDAIENNELRLFYQPKVDIITKQTVGMEALVRWFHPRLGMIPPVKFIGLAEENGLILPIGDWVLNEACRQTACWIRQGFGELKVSVNVSGQQFKEVNYTDSVRRALSVSELVPRQLMLEMTESLAMSNVDSSVTLMAKIKQLGVGLSIDDFGTGYSSLSYLKRFPLDELKIDRSFIMGIPDNRDEVQIVQAIIAMAKALRLSVVIEGVETQAQLNMLEGTQCDLIQGFIYSKPLPAEQFERFMETKDLVTA